jgi:hypothetical protein
MQVTRKCELQATAIGHICRQNVIMGEMNIHSVEFWVKVQCFRPVGGYLEVLTTSVFRVQKFNPEDGNKTFIRNVIML